MQKLKINNIKKLFKLLKDKKNINKNILKNKK